MIPSFDAAKAELRKAGNRNPGPWTQHSMNVAEAARLIAARCDGLDEEKAFVFGLLHDIGRRAGVVAKRHIWEGYRYLTELGWEEAARICLTHSFPVKDIDKDISRDDLEDSERESIRSFLSEITYDDYDKLIILCDSLADARGFCLLEKRFVDVGRRYGLPAFTLERWNQTFAYKEYFEEMAGIGLYELLPNVRVSTFEPSPVWTPERREVSTDTEQGGKL